MFPVTSGTEMAGQAGENAIANAAAVENLPLVWSLLAERLRENPVYVDLFMRVYPDLSTPREITFTHAANAIGAFEAVAWRADNSPFDRYLRGDKRAMSREAKRGMKLFYGSFNCVSCHSGVFQTDHKFHAIAMPQIGPGKGDGPNGHADFGRERVTGARLDRYKFRTPSLRNVVLTGPWGHDGAYDSLRGIVLHHLDPQGALDEYDISQAVLSWRADLSTIDSEVMGDPDQVAAIAEACELQERRADGLQRKVSDLIAFLHALTDPASLDLRSDVPATVPSGLPLAE
jgi:cytochrome c peroxidase